jgi:hypothetical protein
MFVRRRSRARPGNLQKRLVRHLKRGIVDQHVELAELIDRPADQRPTVVAVADIAGHGHTAPAGLLDDTPGLGGVLVLLPVPGPPTVQRVFEVTGTLDVLPFIDT